MFRGFKKLNCLARERNFLIFYKVKMTQNFEDLSSENAIFENQGGSSRSHRPPLARLLQSSIILDQLKKADFLRMSRARARFVGQHRRVQNVCATEEHAAGAGRRHI